jgi:hypothetical protein
VPWFLGCRKSKKSMKILGCSEIIRFLTSTEFSCSEELQKQFSVLRNLQISDIKTFIALRKLILKIKEKNKKDTLYKYMK